MIAVDDLPFNVPQTDPLKSLRDTIIFSADDWAQTRSMAWAYGIVVGWDMMSMNEFALKFGWNQDQINRLRKLHIEFKKIGNDA